MRWSKARVAELAASQAFLTHDGLAMALAGHKGFVMIKRDFLFRSGKWRNRTMKAAWPLHATRTLVIGYSDYSLTPLHSAMLTLLTRRRKVLWGSNITSRSRFMRSIPLGLTNFSKDSSVHPIFGNQEHFVRALEKNSEREPRLYANFDPRTALSFRMHLHKLISDAEVPVQMGQINVSDSGRENYLGEIYKSSFVLCPRGNGLDTHRLFETLIMGSVPVLLRSEVPAWLSQDSTLPKIVLERWEDLRKLQISNYEHLIGSVDLTSLTNQYWAELIVNS